MKKVLKMMTIVALMVVTCVTLAGCGDEGGKSSKSKDGRVIATKQNESAGYNERMEVSFKDGKADEMKYTFEFKDETMAKQVKNYLDFGENAKVDVDGNKITVTMNVTDFMKEQGIDTEEDKTSKEDMRKIFEDGGYTVTVE